MTKRTVIAVVLAVVWSGAARADELTTVRSLYASAAYEEALALLDKVRTPEAPELVEQYRALCLLALGRSADAERALETLVKRQPRFDFADTEVPPRLVELFHTVRNRTLPATVRAMYARGKASFDAQRFEEASAQFTELIALSSDTGVTESDSGSLRDLIELGQGFLKLAEAETARIAAARLAPPEAVERAAAAIAPEPTPVNEPAPSLAADTPPPAPVALPAAGEKARTARTPVAARHEPQPFALHPPITYTVADEGIVHPVEISRSMPRWVPGNPLLRRATFRGVLEFVIDERGGIESASLVVPISPLYDSSLLEATATWRFTPATKNGRPVKFRKRIEVVLQPSKE